MPCRSELTPGLWLGFCLSHFRSVSQHCEVLWGHAEQATVCRRKSFSLCSYISEPPHLKAVAAIQLGWLNYLTHSLPTLLFLPLPFCFSLRLFVAEKQNEKQSPPISAKRGKLTCLLSCSLRFANKNSKSRRKVPRYIISIQRRFCCLMLASKNHQLLTPVINHTHTCATASLLRH